MNNDTWQQKVAAKRAEGAAKIPSEWLLPKDTLERSPRSHSSVLVIPRTCGILTAEELSITEQEAISLRDKLAAGELSAVQVTAAFCKWSAIAQQLICCLTETIYPQAIFKLNPLRAGPQL